MPKLTLEASVSGKVLLQDPIEVITYSNPEPTNDYSLLNGVTTPIYFIEIGLDNKICTLMGPLDELTNIHQQLNNYTK